MQLFLGALKKIFSLTNLRFFSLFLILFFLLGDVSFAAEASTAPASGEESQITQGLNKLLAGLAGILGVVSAFIGMFLSPGWVNGTLFGLTDYLRLIWILVSNVVYFIFAFILVTIAFMNIIGKGEGNWELKQALPRFIVGVLIVPFTWFLVQFVISISGVLTYSVLSLPYDVFQNETLFQDSLESELFDESICRHYVFFLNRPEGGYGNTEAIEGAEGMSENLRCENGDTITIRDIISGENGGAGVQNSMLGIMSIYTYGILKVHQMDEISEIQLSEIWDLLDLTFDVLFNLLFVVVYLLLMLALFLALLVRGIKLWLFVMISPLFGLMYFFKKEKDGFGEGGANYSIAAFIHLAFIPVYVAAALAFGLTFIMLASEGIRTNGSDANFTFLDVGGIKLEIRGTHGGQHELNPIGKLIIELFGVVILWIAVMTALSKSEHTKRIVDPIAQFGTSMGKLAAAAPTYAPIIPTGSGGMSAAGLGALGGRIEGHYRGEAQNTGTNFADSVLGLTNGALGDLNRTLRGMSSTNRENGEGLRDALQSVSGELAASTAERRRIIERINEHFGIEINESNLGNNNQTAFAQELERALSEARNNGSLTPNARSELDNRGAINTFVERIFTSGPRSETPPAGSGTGGAGTTAARDVNITINSVPTTAGTYLEGLDIADEPALRGRLNTEGITDVSTINAIIAAYREGLADSDE